MNKRQFPRMLHASKDPLAKLNASTEPNMLRALGSVTLEAAAGDGKSLRKFQMAAYNGGAMRFWWSEDPVVVDLAGMNLGDKSRPVLKDHNSSLVVGHSSQIRVDGGKSLILDGIASGTGEAAREVIANSDNGFPWQSSIGALIEHVEPIAAGVKVTVNGQTFEGPVLIVRACTLQEVSFVALGADDSTYTRMVAGKTQSTQPTRKPSMDKIKILLASLLAMTASFPHLAADLAAKVDVVDDESDETKQGEIELKAWAEKQEKPKIEAKQDDVADALKAARKAAADETRRVGAIRTLCAGKHSDIEAKAIEEGWSAEKAELSVLRASRSSGPAIHTRSGEAPTAEVLEAAVCLTGGLKNAEKAFSTKTLEAASNRNLRHMGLGRLILAAARANGYIGEGSLKENQQEVLRAAFANKLQASGFSTIDISGILSNIANKFLLQGFMAVEQSWKEIAAIRSVTDFKTVTSYRLTGANQYEKVGPTGELKHGTLGEQSFTNKAETYGLMLGITRKDQIDDNLGALTDIPSIIGRGAGLKLNEVFWLEFLDNASFFSTGNKNLCTGTPGSLLTIDGLSAARTKFRKQKDPNGKPIAVAPRILLVPPELEVAADVIVNSMEMRDSTASTKAGTANPHKGKYKVVVSDYLSNDAMTGYSPTAHYMLADPADLPVIEAAFLNGVQTPTVESADADFNTLGIQVRGFHDFGVAKQEFRGGVRSSGA